MPGFYNEVDCVICPSEDEGAGGPVVEGGSAGRLIITTDVGGYRKYITDKGADSCPVPEAEFIEHSIIILKKYIDSPELFQTRCHEIQSYALKTYDWNNFIENWVNLFNK
jgi:glycosyltransferase involved in cell wall biosynthesis